jgi:SpoVK/Ycf46/Vps4 family AAA+-type ATPase
MLYPFEVAEAAINSSQDSPKVRRFVERLIDDVIPRAPRRRSNRSLVERVKEATKTKAAENSNMETTETAGISGDDLKLLGKTLNTSIDDDDNEAAQEVEDDTDYSEDDIGSLRFGEEIKILLIDTVEYRLICHFLGVNNPKDIQNSVYKHVALIGQMNQQCLIPFLESEGYDFAGEIYFDQGQPVPVAKQTWSIKGKEYGFTCTGYMFFEKRGAKNKTENLAAFCWTDYGNGLAGITLYSESVKRSKQVLESLEQYTKNHNCLRGGKLRDVSMSSSTFSEVVTTKKHNWDNYYFPKHIRNLFELEVFGFLKSTDRYNKLGINKRGVLMYGPPGTGKTTIGNIICNEAPESTVILITPELILENNNGKQSIKLLYMLADFVSPAVIFLEDLDLFAEDRDNSQGDIALGGLMNVLDGVNQVKNAVTVATTNRLELIEKALSNRPGRFDRVLEVPTMQDQDRNRMFSDRLKDCKVDNGVVDYIVKLSEGWTGAECQEFVNSMNLLFINKNQDENRHVTKAVVDDVSKVIDNLSTTKKRKRGMGFGE